MNSLLMHIGVTFNFSYIHYAYVQPIIYLVANLCKFLCINDKMEFSVKRYYLIV